MILSGVRILISGMAAATRSCHHLRLLGTANQQQPSKWVFPIEGRVNKRVY